MAGWRARHGTRANRSCERRCNGSRPTALRLRRSRRSRRTSVRRPGRSTTGSRHETCWWRRCGSTSSRTSRAGFLAALEHLDPVEGGRQALGFALDWCREHPPEARLLLLHRREDLLSEGVPLELQDRARLLTQKAERGLRSYARRRFGSLSGASLRRVRFALIDLPFAAVRRDLESGSRPSREVDDLVLTSYDAVFAASRSPKSAASGLRSK